jgi:hypothetical protein
VVEKQLTNRFLSFHYLFSPSSSPSPFNRKIFPKDYQMSMAIIGGYLTLFMISKLIPGGKKAPEPAAIATQNDGGMPSIESAEFGEWLGKEGNFEKIFN